MEVTEPGTTDLSGEGYKRTEVGVIPTDWEVKLLHSLAERITVGIANAATHAYRERGVVMFRNQNIKPNHLDDRDVLYIDELFEQRYRNKRLKPGDLLTARTGYPGTTCIVPPGYDGAQTFTTLITRPRKAIVDPQYLCFFINSEAGQRYIEQSQAGGSQKNVNAGSLKFLTVAMPPTMAEQETIVEALSDADALVQSLEQLLIKKRRIKLGAMQELLTGKTRLPGFSAEWDVMSLGDLFNFSGGFTASRDQLSSEGYCYLHYGDIHASTKSFIDVASEYEDIPKLNVPLKRVSSASLLDDGDVVFVDASEDDEGTSRHVVIINPNEIPFISGLHTIVAKSKTELLNHQYRRYCFQTDAIKSQFRFFAVGTKVSGISKTNIARVTLPVPPLPEQEGIATILADMDAAIAALEIYLMKTSRLEQGMVQELLTGRIRLA